jgi:hypothetical protein
MDVPHHHHRSCACCAMSRRCFLAASGAAAAAIPFAGREARAADGGELDDYIELGSFRPKPEVRVVGAVLRLPPPYWLGWPGTSYDVEGMRAKFMADIAGSARRLGVTWLPEAAPLENEEAVNAFVTKLTAEKPDAVVLTLQHLNVWGWADAIRKSGVPTIIFSPIGTSFTQHVVKISREQGCHVVSSLDMNAVEQALRMIRAKKQLEATRLLIVAGDTREDSQVDRLGITIRRVPRNTLHELFAKMPENDETHEVARAMRRAARKMVEPNKQDTLNAARSYMTAKRLLKDEEANAITSDCLGMVTQREVPTPPCMAATIFQDHGVTYGCEADVNAAMSMLLVSYLFDKPGFMQDPVPETVKNVLIAAHCTSGTRLNGFDEKREPFILRSHSESAIGVATQVLWKENQPVTLAQFMGPHELIVDEGVVVGNVDTPPAGGCRTSVEIEMKDMEDARDVRGFHQAVFYGHHKRDVEAFCQMYGIKAVHSPKDAPEPKLT